MNLELDLDLRTEDWTWTWTRLCVSGLGLGLGDRGLGLGWWWTCYKSERKLLTVSGVPDKVAVERRTWALRSTLSRAAATRKQVSGCLCYQAAVLRKVMLFGWKGNSRFWKSFGLPPTAHELQLTAGSGPFKWFNRAPSYVYTLHVTGETSPLFWH